MAALRRLNILDSAPEPRFDRITQLASKSLGVETVLISLVDAHRQWFKSACNLDARETPRDHAFCAFAINEKSDRLVIPDATADIRFASNPLVTGAPHIRAYAGIVLRSSDGLPLGTLCTIAYAPRAFDVAYLEVLEGFAELVRYEIHRASWDLEANPPQTAELDQGPGKVAAISFESVLALREKREVFALRLRFPRIESLTRAYGERIVGEFLDEVERRVQLAVAEYPHHIERSHPRELSVLVGCENAGIEGSAEALKQRILQNIGGHVQTRTVTLSTPVRIGMSLPATPGCSVESLLRCAEIAIEHINASRVGPACKLYDQGMGERAGRYNVISASVVEAVDSGDVELHYQPKVCVATNVVQGIEALCRWHHPELGQVPPPEMLQVLDDLDLTERFDLWVLREACKQIQRWSLDKSSEPGISVNISGSTLLEPSFPERACEAVESQGLSPALIELEILESVVVEDMEHATAQIQRCKELGFSVALDDFGAGQTSLAYLSRLPVDTVKIDREFVVDIVNDPTASNLLYRIIAMCKSLGKSTVVEGVETVGQFLLLRSFGCDAIQGFYFAKPMPVKTVGESIESGPWRIEPKGLQGL